MPDRAFQSAPKYNSSRGKNPCGDAKKFYQTSSVLQVSLFWCDNGNVNYNSSNANFPNVGGNYNDGTNAGVFYCNVNNNSTNSNSNNGSRNSTTIIADAPSTMVENLHDRASWQNTTCNLRTLVLPLGVRA